MTHTPRSLSALLQHHGLEASKALGQNFVVDPNTVRRIARLADVGPGSHVVEIGAGLGSLTLALLETGASVTAVEVDKYLLPVLTDVLADHPVRIVAGDAMDLDWDDVLAGSEGWVLVANLPYNVATPLILDLLAEVPAIERMLVMVQKEAGERLAAGPGSRTYGIPSVKVALRAEARIVGTVSPEVFLPRPRVDSALVEIVRRTEPATTADPEVVIELVEAAFNQRRKMLRRSLGALVSAETFERAAVDPQSRPEQLGLEEWDRLALAVQRRRAPGAS